jgi:hypothetical protein
MGEANNRLVKRYQPTDRVQIKWTGQNRGKRRVLPHGASTATVDAVIIDVSVTGMYLELPLRPAAEAGDVVSLSSDGHRAVAKVVRASVDEIRGCQLVGVEIAEMSPEFASDLHTVVAALRGDTGQLTEWWERR